MVNIQALREKIANLAQQANHLLAEKGDQVWTKEEQAKFDNLANEMEAAKAQIKAAERMRELEADEFFMNAAGQPQARGGDVSIKDLEAVALYMRFGNNVSTEQALAIRNAMSTTTPGEGGYTVPAEIATMVIDRLKAFGGMRAAAT